MPRSLLAAAQPPARRDARALNPLASPSALFPSLAGDFSHVISILVLLLRLRVSRSALGISLKTQELFLIVFLTRYVDLFTSFYGVYNSFMKVAYIASTSCVSSLVSSRRLAIARAAAAATAAAAAPRARDARAPALTRSCPSLASSSSVAPRAATSSP